MESFAELRGAAKERLDLLSDKDLETVTFKTLKEDLLSKFSAEDIGKWKEEIKGFLGEYAAQRLNPAENGGEDGGNDDGEQGSDEGEQESEGSGDESAGSDSSSDTDDPSIAALPAEWKEAFGEICWAKGQKSFPWWPAYIYNPSRLNAKLRSKAIPVAGKKHTVLYFGSKDFGFVPPSQIKFPFDDFKEEFSKQTITKKYLGWFQQAIPDAEAELAKPKEDRMFIERPRRKRKSTSSSKKKTPTALKKKTPAKKKDTKEEDKDGKVEPEDEDDDQNEEQDEDEDEEEVVSEDESEAEFEDSPKKKSKAPAKEKKSDKPKKSEKATTPRPEKPRKSEASQSEDVPKKKKRPSTDGEQKPKAEKGDPTSKKPKGEGAKSKPDSQKKRKAEEEALAEAERERIKKLQKSSDVPVWKQVRQETGAETAPPREKKKEKESKSKEEKPAAATPKVEETREQRAKRLTGLIDFHLKKSPPNIDGALKCMAKAKDMNLTIHELRGSGFADTINQLRKHSEPSIANEAKSIRNHLKQALQQGVVPDAPPEKAPPVEIPEPEPTTTHKVESVSENMEVVKPGDVVLENPEPVPCPSTIQEGEDLKSSRGPHFETSVRLLCDANSALHEASPQVIERIVATVTRLSPDSADTLEEYVTNIHKFSFQLKSEKHTSLLQAFLAHPVVANIEYLVRTSPEAWARLPSQPPAPAVGISN